jgi:hypothetical protein
LHGDDVFNLDLYKFRRIDLDETAWIDLQVAITHDQPLKRTKMSKWNALDMHIWTSMLLITNNKRIDRFTLINTAILLMNTNAVTVY